MLIEIDSPVGHRFLWSQLPDSPDQRANFILTLSDLIDGYVITDSILSILLNQGKITVDQHVISIASTN